MIPRPELTERFESRHLGPTEAEIDAMLAALGYDAIEALAADAVPPAIRSTEPADLPGARAIGIAVPAEDGGLLWGVVGNASADGSGIYLVTLHWARRHDLDAARRRQKRISR